jgi:ribosomal protein S18 acetylase RimI-like enzyme
VPDLIRSATTSDAGAVASILGAAFADDPVFAWEFPDPATRSRIVRSLLALVAERLFLPAGSSTLCDDGAALWQPPGYSLDGAMQPDLGRAFFEAVDGQMERLLLVSNGLEERHPREPHWYLPAIGVRPSAHGRGIGGELLSFTLKQVDEAGQPAYLEATSRRSAALYQRHGFEVLGEFSVADSPTLWLMWRPALPAGAGEQAGR